MKDWIRKYPTRRERLLNELRKYHYDKIRTPTATYMDVTKGLEVINGLSKRICSNEKAKV